MTGLEDFFAPEGALAGSIGGYAPRAAQVRMAEAVAQALADGENLVVEAGTGTGKTFAYLAPALLSGRRVIISTGTRNLQDQLFHRDLPALTAALGAPVRSALLKGRSNYLCRQRLEIAMEMHRPSDAASLAHIQAWDRLTKDGDIAGLAGIPERSPIWPAVTSTAENCLGQDCPALARCHVLKARRAAQESQIVVVNHHLLLADLALKEDGFGELLPESDAVIVDEAHQLPAIANQFFGIRFAQGQLEALARDLLAETVREPSAGAATEGMDRAVKAARDARLAMPHDVARVAWPALGSGVEDALWILLDHLVELGAILAPMEAGPGLANCRRRVAELQTCLQTLLDACPGDGLRWVETSRRRFVFHLTPVAAAAQLRQAMENRPGAWVFTSATLAVGEDFSHFESRVGIEQPRRLQLESPFDYASNTLLYLPKNMPEPGDPGHTRAVVNALRPVLSASGGRAFALFTSHRALDEARNLLQQSDINFPLLVQGEAPRDELLRKFRELGNAVLLGTGSFWEGVDVRGPALSVVAIDKLPFASPGDPLLQARIDAIRDDGGNPFFDFQLPQAVIALKQGIGRLIRDVDDRGVAVLCDPRLRSRNYGRKFLRSLPKMPLVDEPGAVEAFFAASLPAAPKRSGAA